MLWRPRAEKEVKASQNPEIKKKRKKNEKKKRANERDTTAHVPLKIKKDASPLACGEIDVSYSSRRKLVKISHTS